MIQMTTMFMLQQNKEEGKAMKITVWAKRDMTIYVGGDPEQGKNPEITIEVKDPQLSWDTDKYTMIVRETK